MASDSVASLAPGFRFHPTDEELVRYYLKRKVCNKPLRFDAISVVDIYKSEPWDLPDKSKLKSRDLEWYFFSGLDKKNGNGSKTNRATDRGYWKTTGKDREIRNGPRTVGMKKTLVYHQGRAPRGERTNWVMHEYRLADEELQTAGVAQDAFVLCRVFQKSGSGPKNGEQYGAPFVEEEWEDDDLALVPEQDALKVEVANVEDIYLDLDDFDQKLDTLPVHENHSASLNLNYGESSKIFEPDSYSDSRNYIDSGNYANSGNHMDSGNYVEPGIWDEQSRDFGELEEDQKTFIGTVGMQYGSIMPEDQVASGLVEQNTVNVRSDKNEFAAGTSYNTNPDMNYLLDELYMDANDDILFGNDMYLEANDLLNTPEASFNFEEYLTFSDTEDNNAQHLSFDKSQLENENFVRDLEDFTQKQPVADRLGLASMEIKSILEEQDQKEASFSEEDKKAGKLESDSKYSFLRKASHMLGNIPAPPAFASEFPAKEAAIRPHSAAQSSGFNVNAGMMRISNIKLTGNGLDWSYDKNGNVKFVLSFGVVQNDEEASAEKSGSGLSRGMFFYMCFWVLILSVSFKIGTCICAR